MWSVTAASAAESPRRPNILWIVETQDQGVFPEPDEVVEPFEKEMHDWFGTPGWYPYTPPNGE
jgi:hypothetical protein